jgi:hypothetical protein
LYQGSRALGSVMDRWTDATPQPIVANGKAGDAGPLVRLGFNVYGAGNPGDDLTLAGTLELLPPHVRVVGYLPLAHLGPMRIRFPRVEWLPAPGPAPRADEVWLGAGVTPIQVLSGSGFIRHLETELLGRRYRRTVMSGIGVEEEALPEAARFRRILERVDFITARDDMSAAFLIRELGVPPSRVRAGGDLANLFLETASSVEPDNRDRPVTVAVNFYRERFDLRSRLALARFFRHRPRGEYWCFLLNETRTFPHSERALYRVHQGLWGLANRHGWLPMITPNYLSPRIEDLVSHLAHIETVLATRYHLLLAAAWYGCRVCGIARSSKIAALCGDLDIPIIDGPLTERTLHRGIAAARRVDRERLVDLAARGRAAHATAISRLLDWGA